MKKTLLHGIQGKRTFARLLHWLRLVRSATVGPKAAKEAARVPSSEEARPSPEPLLTYPADAEKEIVQAVRSGDIDALDRTFCELRRLWAPLMFRPEMPFVCFLLALDALKEAARGTEHEEELRAKWYRQIVEKLAMGEATLNALDCAQEISQALALERAKLAEEKTKEIVEQAKQIIEDTIADNLSVEQIANRVHFSSAHLGKLFKTSTGNTLLEYMTERKMRKSCLLLAQSEATVSRIASQVGYANVKSFSRMFKATQGVTPSEYRKMANEQGQRQ